MSISKQQARAIAKKKVCEELELTVIDQDQSNHNVYLANEDSHYWVVNVKNIINLNQLTSSEIVLVS